MENFGMATVVAITVISYLLGEAVKLIPAVEHKIIPVICGSAGGVLGILAMHIMPAFPAQDYLTAAAVGIASGLAATGCNQVRKQLGSGKEAAE
ncbi:MAG: phage holin family protein [Oscillospiraceae bacterium]|nr:phage holin family protein [Oscillospiraceae bacterium]